MSKEIKYYKRRNKLIEESKIIFESMPTDKCNANNIYLIYYIIDLVENRCPKKMAIEEKIHYFFIIFEKKFELKKEEEYQWIANCIMYMYNRNIILKNVHKKWKKFKDWFSLKSIRYGENQIMQYTLPGYMTTPLYTLHIKQTVVYLTLALGVNKMVALIIIGFLFA